MKIVFVKFMCEEDMSVDFITLVGSPSLSGTPLAPPKNTLLLSVHLEREIPVPF